MLLSALASVALISLGDLPSGPNPGDKLPEFKVHSVFGPQEGKEIEVLKATKDGPTLLIFIHKLTRPALQCLRPVDDYAAKAEKLGAHVIWLGEKDKTEDYIKRAKDSLKFQLPQSVALEKDGPPAYGLNDQVTLTILLARDRKVVSNFAFTDPNGTDGPKVVAAIAKLLGKEPPKAEEKKRPEVKRK